MNAIPDLKFEDARKPTEPERERLSRLMYMAFCDLRALSREGRCQQARELAEAFHNIPLLMHTGDFSFQAFRDLLKRYQDNFAGNLRFDYLQEWEKLNTAVQ